MRIVVYGVGAIGGAVAAALAHGGEDVIGVARGAQLDAIRAGGLRLRWVEGDLTSRFPCVGTADEVALRDVDIVLLAVKSRDTAAALDALMAAGLRDQPLFCLQNGVANEPLAHGRGLNAHGVAVMMPATFLIPGEIAVHCAPRLGIFEIGRYPDGCDDADADLAARLTAANVAAFVSETVMDAKYGKLLMNLGNVVQAALGPDAESKALLARVRGEAAAVFSAAGIAVQRVDAEDPRRARLMQMGKVEGLNRPGGSTVQSLLRGTGTVETDFLNGEIVRLGELHGVPTPLNRGLAALGRRMAEAKAAPGAYTPQALADLLGDGPG